jgi:hypothetical protein
MAQAYYGELDAPEIVKRKVFHEMLEIGPDVHHEKANSFRR